MAPICGFGQIYGFLARSVKSGWQLQSGGFTSNTAEVLLSVATSKKLSEILEENRLRDLGRRSLALPCPCPRVLQPRHFSRQSDTYGFFTFWAKCVPNVPKLDTLAIPKHGMSAKTTALCVFSLRFQLWFFLRD